MKISKNILRYFSKYLKYLEIFQKYIKIFENIQEYLKIFIISKDFYF